MTDATWVPRPDPKIVESWQKGGYLPLLFYRYGSTFVMAQRVNECKLRPSSTEAYSDRDSRFVEQCCYNVFWPDSAFYSFLENEDIRLRPPDWKEGDVSIAVTRDFPNPLQRLADVTIKHLPRDNSRPGSWATLMYIDEDILLKMTTPGFLEPEDLGDTRAYRFEEGEAGIRKLLVSLAEAFPGRRIRVFHDVWNYVHHQEYTIRFPPLR